MTWGKSPWGTSSWGTGAAAPPPTLIGVTSPFGIAGGGAALVERRGGTVVTISGTNFRDPLLIEILTGASPSFTVVGTGFLFDAEFDLEANRAFVGMPALVDGVYHLRVTSEGGPSNVILDALEWDLFPEEYKAHRTRKGFARVWDVGPRFL